MESNRDNSFQHSCSRSNNYRRNVNSEESERSVSYNRSDASLCTQQKLELSSWGLPEKVLEFYHSKRITHMFNWQFECLTLGRVLNSGNLVYSAPTSAGKTLVAEILISKCLFELEKKILVILPFVSVVREKMFYFQGMYGSSGIHVEGYMGGHSPSLSFKQVHLAVCTIEKANSIINRLLEEKSLQNLGLVVVDELHMLGDPYRGYLLELLLTKLKYISMKMEYQIQIVGMSATLPNLKSLADWLSADVFYTDFRPVPLNEKLKCGSILYDKWLNKVGNLVSWSTETSDDLENVGQLCLETIGNGHSVLIFCPTKIWCENLAEKISLYLRKIGCSKAAETEGTPGWVLRKELNLKNINEVIEHLKMCPVGLDKDLHRTIAYGVAFHHAGLTLEERDIIEGSFRKGSLRVICATSTLSSGVNLPARRVIIRSPVTFGGLMDTLTYRQMIGRAGRMGVDSEGESILICKPNEKSMCQSLMCSTLKPIESCLGHGKLSASLKRALLEIVASGIASTPEEVRKYASCTFLACSSRHDMKDPLQSCIEFLEENEFIRFQGDGTVYTPTPLGKACLASSLPPDEGLALFQELQRARRCFVLDTDLHIIYQVTPYSVSEQWNKVDWFKVLNTLEGLPESMKRVGEMVGVEESFLVKIVKGTLNSNAPDNKIKLSIHRRFYTSLALQDLVNEVPLSEVAQKYDCNKGMLQSLQQSAATYAGMVTEFTKCLGWSSVELIFSQFQERLQFGIRRELCELMRLPLLNAMRARALFDAGFTSLSSIANASTIDLENVFFNMAPFQSKKEIAGETRYDKEQRNKLEAIWITGKADLTVREAVDLLITECRSILETELGLEDVKWGKKDNALNKTQEFKVNFQAPNPGKCKEGSKDCSATRDKSFVTYISLHEERKQIEFEADNKRSFVVMGAENARETSGNGTAVRLARNCEVGSARQGDVKREEVDEKLGKLIALRRVDDQGDRGGQKLRKSEGLSEEVVESTNSSGDGAGKQESSIAEEGLDRARSPENGKAEVIYSASSLRFGEVAGGVTPSKVVCEAVDSKDKERRPVIINESDSDSSVEILYESAVHDATKNLSFSRLSDDAFEVSGREGERIKNMSTPIASHSLKNRNVCELSRSRLSDVRSPDLFSQSLTFDTQMGRILDFEEGSAEENPQVVNPSLESDGIFSINSDDLGFVSDLSPKPRKADGGEKETAAEEKEGKSVDLQEAGTSASRLEREGGTFPRDPEGGTAEGVKRKTVDSPDFVAGSGKQETFRPTKRVKYNASDAKEVFLSPCSAKGSESDDEIMPTPELEKPHSSSGVKARLRTESKLKKRNREPKALVNTESHFNSNGFGGSSAGCPENSNDEAKLPNLKAGSQREVLTVEKINVIDVCGGEEDFKFFCEELKKQNILGVALGCRNKVAEKRDGIGAKVTRKRRVETERKTFRTKCGHDDLILDGIAFYWRGDSVFYMGMDGGGASLDVKINLLKNLSREMIFRIFDAKEQIKVLQKCSSVLLSSSLQDPKVAYWLLAEKWKDKNFSAMVLEFIPSFKSLLSHIGTVVGSSSPGLFLRSNTPPKVRASLEAFLTYHLVDRQLPLLLKKGLQKSYEVLEMPIMLCLAEMEVAGFRMCRQALLNVAEKLSAAKAALEEKAYSLANQKFTISSAAAVSKVLYKILSLGGENVALTKRKKVPSTSKEALQELANTTKHPLPDVILQWRKVRSISTKFVSPLLQKDSSSTAVVGISQTFTVTGRISMHEPNLQNIPKNFVVNCKEDESISINLREVFVASENCVLMSVDYCQIELRVLAHLSRDLRLIRNITESSDIFVNIAATVFSVPHNVVNGDLRQRAKQVCYGIIYGIGSRSLARQLQIEEPEAVQLIHDFKNKYQGVKDYLEVILSECRKKGYVTTLFNRRRYIPSLNDANQAIRMEGERQAVNTTIQGSAADLVKKAMVLLREKIVSNKLPARLVLHLHDELIFEVGRGSLEAVATLLKETMESAMDISVPTPVKIKIGPNWGKLQDLGHIGRIENVENMNTDPGILVFQHCDKKVFCFELPPSCPACDQDLSTDQFKLLPIRIPYPFVRAVQHPCSILIKPTSGDFLNDYFNSVDLHIGVTDSTGAVVEYDKNGLQRQKNNHWNQCLVLDHMDETRADHWDQALRTVMKEDHWTPQRYNEASHNCYTFVLAFLQRLEHSILSDAACSGTYFCEKFIIPRTTAAGKYISLYRKLRAVKCYIHGGSTPTMSSCKDSL